MYYWIGEELEFPAHEFASKEGVLALGGDLSVERLILAYSNGIFPWFNEDDPIVWYSPLERMVLYPDEFKVSKSMRQVLRKEDFQITMNKDFEGVISNCKSISRKDQDGTWITDDMKTAYLNLHQMGLAKSIEIWKNEELVAGLYGVDLGNGVFCGESMFSKVSNMSKVAFIYLVQECDYTLIDCQVHNDHLESLGAKEIPREEFLKYLKGA
ncbi:leucyl/phenylalanyl-tRNA--protein transferase [Tenacibaculum jejuense]|uniref:Leucyl/phenylalanyl-tRNA--protein transferase n=1 Tax=Tenacibaculum jejuense TaxID=584609 RepID=A0A238UD81_9FLAO|nr:leucyl/phenylalanyl-tRNA--protein transferase [Tenacibaculum jejuense]SNR17121.1 Leucyl/phenylalanyl-tRNA--protein transferase [Tenacibaculum jejuense]